MAVQRRLPVTVIIALGCGCIALIWGLLHLQSIFMQERDDAFEGITARREALRQFAHKELEQELHTRLRGAAKSIDSAVADPLIPASSLYLSDRGEQQLPRTFTFLPGAATPGSDLASQLQHQPATVPIEEPGSPWAERLELLVRLNDALAARDRQGIEESFRAILGHRARYRIRTTRDLPFMVAALANLIDRATPREALLTALLRDGLTGRQGRMEGLQRTLLRSRARFSRADFQELARRLSELCRRGSVLYSDFQTRVAERSAATMPIPGDLREPALVLEGRWYVEPATGGRVQGVAVELPGMLDEITSSMRERALLQDEDEVALAQAMPGGVMPLGDIALKVESPRWAKATADVGSRYQLKAALVIAIGAMIVGCAALGLVVLRRRQRFLELKSQFVSAVSHELRTPLASIRLMAETLERRTKGFKQARDYPSRIVRDIDGLSFLVENILSFNRLDRGRWVPKPEPLRLSDMVDKIAADRDSWSAGRPATVRTEGLEEVVLEADPDLLRLLFTNLVRNACAYNEQPEARITIAAARRGADWRITVSDNGVGIPASEQERVFDDFYRAESGRSRRGSGLGLALCRKVMQAHRGDIRVAETSPEGTTFELRFPAGTGAS